VPYLKRSALDLSKRAMTAFDVTSSFGLISEYWLNRARQAGGGENRKAPGSRLPGALFAGETA
jgi:hypothetical protein